MSEIWDSNINVDFTDLGVKIKAAHNMHDDERAIRLAQKSLSNFCMSAAKRIPKNLYVTTEDFLQDCNIVILEALPTYAPLTAHIFVQRDSGIATSIAVSTAVKQHVISADTAAKINDTVALLNDHIDDSFDKVEAEKALSESFDLDIVLRVIPLMSVVSPQIRHIFSDYINESHGVSSSDYYRYKRYQNGKTAIKSEKTLSALQQRLNRGPAASLDAMMLSEDSDTDVYPAGMPSNISAEETYIRDKDAEASALIDDLFDELDVRQVSRNKKKTIFLKICLEEIVGQPLDIQIEALKNALNTAEKM